MTRLSFMLSMTTILLSLLPNTSYAHQQPLPPRPNIVLIVTDDQGWWDVGVNGNKTIDTPNLDRLARSGMNLKRFYAQPVCAPTRAGLLTGRYYLRTGVYNTRFGGDTMRSEEVTIAEILRRAGYRTGLFGKWHLGRYAGYRPNDQGFDEFFGFCPGHVERYDYPDQLQHNGKAVEARGYITDLFTDAATSFMRQTANRPFFCYLAYNAPHSPFIAGDAHAQQKKGDDLISKYLKRNVPLRDARIYAMIERIDENVGRVMQTLDNLHIAENTIVIFMGDNGGVSRFFRAGLRGAKGSVYEGGVRVPCFVRWTGKIPAGSTSNAMASHLDVLPTLCDILKVQAPPDRKIDGKSLWPLLKNGKGKSPHRFLCHTWNRYFPTKDKGTAIQTSRYKLVGKQLYDLQSDPSEKKNIAKKLPLIVEQLQGDLTAWFADVTIGQKYQPLPIPVGHPEENPVEIQASWAILKGKAINYTFRGYDWDTIDGWRGKDDVAHWNLDVLRSGKYEVIVSYGAEPASAGGKYQVTVGDARLTGRVAATATPDVFRKQRLGILQMSPGRMQLRVHVVEGRGEEVMRLNRVWLRRVDE